MQFPFTFTLNVPGLQNPFLATPSPFAQPRFDGGTISRQIVSLPPRFPPANALPPPVPLARKRGWIPAEPEPSHAATYPASTTGYLDTPAKYRDMHPREPEEEAEEMIAELPPAKRRRTLAGSIVSTALSAALIGTAVGLTVYRLWRDRGKQPEQLPPPPPYHRGDWVPDVPEPVQTPPSPKTRKPRPAPLAARHSVGRHHRKSRARLQTITPSRSVSPAEPDYVHVHRPAGDPEPDPGPEEDRMDWIGDRLAHLIHEGQKALGREVVVMSEVKEDEVDDGSDAWEEEDSAHATLSAPSISRQGSVRSLRRPHKPRDLHLPPSYSPYPVSPPSSASPRKRHFEADSVHRSPGRSVPGGIGSSLSRHIAPTASTESDAFASLSSSFREDESTWQSPELRESMERARARYLQRHVQ